MIWAVPNHYSCVRRRPRRADQKLETFRMRPIPIRVACTHVRRCRGLPRPSKHLILLAFTIRSSPHNVGHHKSRFPSLGIKLSNAFVASEDNMTCG